MSLQDSQEQYVTDFVSVNGQLLAFKNHNIKL